ncbi:hypothetical protein [Weeksella sp. HMSC059D05]|uniref:hypothetical protein n=1 Tax=Weeksella sp. HMSC059D05 TaxID=1715139 RepID=UPI0008A3C281|nr:hypothetical protein [Weeksella sp. HMSC059D05]OFM84559.1 hypothetical protein HMPREF2660_08595 [Weeksella sp. HMSC059D05]
MSTFLPVTIKPYLVHILWKLFDGKEFDMNGRKMKAIKIDLSSSLGRWLRSQCTKANRPARAKFYNMVFEITDCSTKKYRGTVYQYVDGKNNFLHLPTEFVDDFNHLLEDIYRTKICSFLEAYEMHGTIKDGIRDYMAKYDLEEYNQTLESIERLYMREKSKTEKFTRYQHKWTHNMAKSCVSS